MIDFVRNIPFYQVYLFLVLLVIVIAVKKTIELFIIRNEKYLSAGIFGINAILVISGMMIFFAFFFFALGINIGMQYISSANEISPSLVWGGVHIGLARFVFTLHFFMFALIIWFILRTRYNHLLSKSIRKRRV